MTDLSDDDIRKGRIRRGDIFRVSVGGVEPLFQPLTLPLDEEAAITELARQENVVAAFDDDVLRADVLARHSKSGIASWTAVCQGVGKAHGLSGRQVRRIVPDTKW